MMSIPSPKSDQEASSTIVPNSQDASAIPVIQPDATLAVVHDEKGHLSGRRGVVQYPLLTKGGSVKDLVATLSSTATFSGSLPVKFGVPPKSNISAGSSFDVHPNGDHPFHAQGLETNMFAKRPIMTA